MTIINEVQSKTAKGMDVTIIAKNGESYVQTATFEAKIVSVEDSLTSDSLTLELVVEKDGQEIRTGLVDNPGVAKAFFFATKKKAQLMSFESSEANEVEKIRDQIGASFFVENNKRETIVDENNHAVNFCYKYSK